MLLALLLTNLLITNLCSLLYLQRSITVLCAKKLHESVRLLYRYLCKITVCVEDMEDVSFSDLLGAQITCIRSQSVQ